MPGGPWDDAPLEEVQLESAPLLRVLCQVRFPRLARLIADPDAKVPNAVALALDEEYPQFERGHEVAFAITQDGLSQTQGPNPIWRLISADGDWTATLAGESLALETSRYTDRADFLARLLRVVSVLADHVNVPRLERIGFRYTNRVAEDLVPLDELRSLVREPMLGGLGVPLNGQKCMVGMNEATFDMAPGTGAMPTELSDCVQARWGLMPSNGQLDVSLPPYPQPCWMLDIDSYRMYRQLPGPSSLTSGFLTDEVDALSMRAYRFFRWAVTGEFLTRFGATA